MIRELTCHKNAHRTTPRGQIMHRIRLVHRMPNWAYNNMTVESDGSETGDEQLRCFVNVAITEDDNLTFSGHLPMPKELDIGSAPGNRIKDDESLLEALADIENPDTPEWLRTSKLKQIKMYQNKKEFGYNSWYDWNCAKWGVKWDASDSMITPYNGGINIVFNTPWDLPRGWLSHIIDLPECSHLRIRLVCEAEGEAVILNSEGKAVPYEENQDGEWYHSAEYIEKEPNNNGEISHYHKTAEQRWKDGEF